MILKGEVKDAKLSSFHLISKYSLHINFMNELIFFKHLRQLVTRGSEQLESLSYS